MKISLIICTYMRPEAISSLMDSILLQRVVPYEILIIDGSTDVRTAAYCSDLNHNQNRIIKKFNYYKVPPSYRGLTKQRNYGINKVSNEIDIVAFLDDDVILNHNYFYEIINTYTENPRAYGVGGYITNEVKWEKASAPQSDLNYYSYDGYRRKESSRYKLRRKLGLDQKIPPAWYPEFGHGRSVSFLPPSGKTYEVEMLMGGVSSFPLSVLKSHKFSEYFEGYGLYEDADFTLRLSKLGPLYVNTNATLEHHHDASGRPNRYNYGKMVMRNGWYVWRVKFPNPTLKARVKWNTIAGILTLVRLTNVLKGPKRTAALSESLGRIVGWWSLVFNKPRYQNED